MSALYLRFAGALQSWAGPRIAGNHVHTALIPTRSGTLGVLAAALGAPQGEWPEWLHQTALDVRVESAGTVQRDYQTINPRGENQRFAERIWIASGLKRSAPSSFTPDAEKGTSIVIRSYLAGAEFLVRVVHSDRLDEIASACAGPRFSPYLGRKAFAPSFPFLLGKGPAELLMSAPTVLGGARVPGQRAIAIHSLTGEDEDAPRNSITVETASLEERLTWWRKEARLPQRTVSLANDSLNKFATRKGEI
ncbi:type I-E CRISPR-associated protein Cas5/CasD [Leucobacter viscericola]|uniref:Type I-E CRISPR-associated protein Cas5/CasD n=1 Tax=Leucobacter viscericola TaxID=2714935 RepID=A0A6G7XGS6_9MICO|nr:type I-E CRISPR-associated protein Cas5/CasD [Leucobacter viscericola]QIK63597.1 type I-E CRISPR-associated protein Cas5/CasD [Leucobacter viscericola]